jgi:hypothetical protein
MSKMVSNTSDPQNLLNKPCRDKEIRYHPSSELVSFDWVRGAQVLTYLLNHPEERLSLLAEARRQSPGTPKTYCIHHPLLNHTLKVKSSDHDEVFCDSINFLKRKWTESAQYVQSLITTTPSTNSTPTADPTHSFITTIIPLVTTQPSESQRRIRWATSSCFTMEKYEPRPTTAPITYHLYPYTAKSHHKILK